MTFLRNTWYAAAWDHEVPHDGLFQRTLLNESVLFFRDDAGRVQAISNRCPHRFAPLHMGKRYLHARANYLLATDNIMDLSHIQYLHPATLGSDTVSDAIASVKQVGHTVYSNRQTVAEIMPDFLYTAMGFRHGLPVDRWIDVRWDAPANMLLDAGAVATGCARNEGRSFMLPHLFTPETDKTTHYWFAFCMPKALGEFGRQVAEEQVESLRIPFTNEDLPMLEAQQRMMGDADFWSLKPVLLPGDAGAIRARRVLDGLIATEQKQASQPAPGLQALSSSSTEVRP